MLNNPFRETNNLLDSFVFNVGWGGSGLEVGGGGGV